MSFKESLKYGNTLEKEVCDLLKERNVDCYNTKQAPGDSDREIYSTVDVVVRNGENVLVGLECKIQDMFYRKCESAFHYSGNYNVVLNACSLEKYKKANFPVVFVINNKLVGRYYFITLKDLLKIKPNIEVKDDGYRSTDIKYNYNCKNWLSFEHLEDFCNLLKYKLDGKLENN